MEKSASLYSLSGRVQLSLPLLPTEVWKPGSPS